MKYRQILWIAVVMLLTLLVALPQFLPNDGTVSVAVVPQDGIKVLSENPLRVKKGETAVFQVEIQDGYEFGAVDTGSYADGVLTVTDVQRSKSIYFKALKHCTLTLQTEGSGTAALSGGQTALEGNTAAVQVVPSNDYVVEAITVNGKQYPAPSGDTFEFTVEDHSQITVHFAGRPVDFLMVSGNLGRVSVENNPDTYRYGDVLQLSCDYDDGHIVFKGWSTGGFLADGGSLLSNDPKYHYTVKGDAILYANFTDRSSYNLTYDANGGSSAQLLKEEHAPGEYLNLKISDGTFTRDGYTLLGYSEAKDGTGHLYTPGAMMEMPREDLTLYAQWIKNTDLNYLKYSTVDGGIAITGLRDAGKSAGLTQLVLPTLINGKKVVSISGSAFRNCNTLETVVLPGKLTTIGNQAFGNCSALTTVYFPETITSLSTSAFDGSTAFANMRVIASLGRAFDYDYDSALADKYMRLKQTEGKRIILVGGSSLAFGLNSVMIQEKFPDYSVINMGVSMYYGILPTFDILEANVREGDIVIFCPEYSNAMYAYREIDAITNWQYLESNYDILQDIDLTGNPRLLRYYTSYLSTKRGYLPGKKVNGNGVYVRTGFNQYGDLIVKRGGGKSYGLDIPAASIITDLGMERYNALCKTLTERGAKCCFSFPPHSSGGASKDAIKNSAASFTKKLNEKLDSRYCTVISEIQDYYFSGKVFYDNNYHMTLDGAKLRTEQLIRDLEDYLGG